MSMTTTADVDFISVASVITVRDINMLLNILYIR